MKNLITILCFVLLGSLGSEVMAQAAPKARKSPLAIAQLKSGKTYVRIVYSQPHKNERTVFGGLVPLNKVWRLGANEATEITITHKIKMGGKTIPAGTYSLFAIPQADKWTIILNKDIGLWGDYDYKQANDLARFDVAVKTVDQPWEAFTIKFDKTGRMNLMTMVWDRTSVEIPIEILK
jgi:hypothetical protein